MKENKITNREENLPSIGDLLIATLFSCKSSKRFHSIIRERMFDKYKQGSVSVALSRLNKKGYVIHSNDKWRISQKGRGYHTSHSMLEYMLSPFEKGVESNTILSFDISEPDRRLRDWLRNQLKIFGYKMLQQSLWFGPGPLPQEFLKKIKDLKIKENVKIFTIKSKSKNNEIKQENKK